MVVVAFLVVYLDLFEEVYELCEGVWVAVGKEDLLSIMLATHFWCIELEGETELVEVPDLGWVL